MPDSEKIPTSRAGSSPLPDGVCPSRARGLVERAFADEHLVIHVRRRKIFRLNPTARTIWEHADGSTSVAEITELLLANHDAVDPGQVRADVERCLAHLEEEQLLDLSRDEA